MDWQTLYDMAEKREQNYLQYLNNKFSEKYFKGQNFASLREALNTIFAINYTGNNFVPDKKKSLSSYYAENALSEVVKKAYNVYFGNNKYMTDYIISMLPWTTDHGNYPQKLSQMLNAKDNKMRAGYFNEMVITENIIHSLIKQYPGIDFSVDVKNYGKGDFTLYLEGKDKITKEADISKLPNIPFDAKSNLSYFPIQSMGKLSKKVQKKVKNMLDTYTLNERIEQIYVPEEIKNFESSHYISSEEREGSTTYIYYDLPAEEVDSRILYQLLYNLLSTKVPIFVTTNNSIPEFILATELIESKMDSTKGLFLDLESNKPQEVYTTNIDSKKAKDELLKLYLKEINNLKIIGGKR